jgi:hypothetical protein
MEGGEVEEECRGIWTLRDNGLINEYGHIMKELERTRDTWRFGGCLIPRDSKIEVYNCKAHGLNYASCYYAFLCNSRTHTYMASKMYNYTRPA